MMHKRIAIFCIFIALPQMEAGLPKGFQKSNVDNLVNSEFQITQQNARDKSNAQSGSLVNYQLTWNPMLITGDPLLDELCDNNLDDNYPNPFNCTQFIMCADGDAYLAACPANCVYNPLEDECVYKGSPEDQCPWRSTWYDPDNLNCTVAKRPFSGYLTFPKNPRECCGEEVYYCNKSEKKGEGRCKRGFGYCKAFFACLNYRTCKSFDDYFHLKNI